MGQSPPAASVPESWWRWLWGRRKRDSSLTGGTRRSSWMAWNFSKHPSGKVSLPCRNLGGEAVWCHPVTATPCPILGNLLASAVPTALPLGCVGSLVCAVSLHLTSQASLSTAPWQLPTPAGTSFLSYRSCLESPDGSETPDRGQHTPAEHSGAPNPPA